MTVLTDEELTRFGISPDDDGFHPFDPDDPTWNESWFWDWYDESGSVAGHCRIGTMPGEDRVWLWLYLLRGDEWFAVEQPFLPIADLRRPELAMEQPGLSFSYRIADPLRAGELRVQAAARVISGPRSGRVVPVAVELDIEALGAPHSTGQGNVAGHESDVYDARRFEQPIALTGTLRFGDDAVAFVGRGERDHSWGPRYWQIEWSFLVANGEDRRLMCVEVRFPGEGDAEATSLAIGYLHDTATHDLSSVALTVERSEDLAVGVRGRVEVRADDGAALAADFAALRTHEMDLSHVLAPGTPSRYRRSLIRCEPDDGGAPMLGWLEDHVLTKDVE